MSIVVASEVLAEYIGNGKAGCDLGRGRLDAFVCSKTDKGPR